MSEENRGCPMIYGGNVEGFWVSVESGKYPMAVEVYAVCPPEGCPEWRCPHQSRMA